jgi:hypothetical protein
LGQDLFPHLTYVDASEFFCSTEDIGLIDFVHHKSAKKIWHCSDILKSIMLRKAIIAVYTEATKGSNESPIPEWLSSILGSKSQQSNPMTPKLQFLGLVSLYQTKTES